MAELSELEILLTELERQDIKLWVEGDKLRFDAPPGALTTDWRTRLQASKPILIEYLTQAGVHEAREGFPFLTDPQRAGIHPLSFAQRHFGLLQLRYPEACFYNVPFGFRIEGVPDVDALQKSLDAIVVRHEFLRTTLQAVEGEIRQVVMPAATLAIRLVDLQGLSGSEQQAGIEREIQSECHTPFDLARDCTLRVRLLSLAEQHHLLLLCLHNTLFDTGSLRALLHEIGHHYAMFTGSAPVSSLPGLPMPYAGCVRWQQAQLAGNLAPRLSYWRDWFKKGEPPALTQIIAGQEKPPATFQAATSWCALTAGLTAKLKQFSQEQGVSLFMTLISAYALVLSRHSGCTDVVLGTTLANRNHWKLEPLIGSLLNILALRFDFEKERDYGSLLQQTRRIVLAAFDNQDIPFAVMSPLLTPDAPRTTPLFRTVFSFLGELSRDELKLAGVSVEFMEEIHGAFMFPDLYPTVWERQTPDGLALTSCWQYKQGYLSETTVLTLMADFRTLLADMVEYHGETGASSGVSENRNVTLPMEPEAGD
ncbi:hypothetical protein FJZ55_06755 [Candidatus Woesearchaeota archaeon]|nr:hypothetical protein [Candidatus Woesearchaeota archaeon]